jgi:hypothetical protein
MTGGKGGEWTMDRNKGNGCCVMGKGDGKEGMAKTKEKGGRKHIK